MTNEEFIRQAYAVAEVKDVAAWVACFNPDGVFVDMSVGITYRGPSEVGQGVLPATGKRMDAPCCDVFRLKDGRIQLFDCYPSGTVVLGQLGVLGNLDAALQQHAVA
jgi:ketosteroid isomerase-like protein